MSGGGEPDKEGQAEGQLLTPIRIHGKYIFLRLLNRKHSSFLGYTTEFLHNCQYEEKNGILVEEGIAPPLGKASVLIHFSWREKEILAFFFFSFSFLDTVLIKSSGRAWGKIK